MSSLPEISARLRASLWQRFPELAELSGRGGWIVGGALRDVLIDREPVDCDLVFEDARVEAERFGSHFKRRPVALGKQRAETWIVTIDDRRYELTSVTRGSIEEDLGRRDFTINAMALPIDAGRLLDLHGGAGDLEKRRLRQIDEQNFVDDPLRVLKGVRTAAELDLEVEPATFEAMKRHASRLEDVAAERVWSELTRAFDANARRSLELIDRLGMRSILLLSGEWANEAPTNFESAVKLDASDVLSILFRRASSEDIEQFVARWKVPAATRATLLMQRHLASTITASLSECEMSIALHDAGESESLRFARIDREHRERLLQTIDSNRELFRSRDLLDGDELREQFGMSGKEIGLWKRRLLEARICGLIVDREAAVEFLREKLREQLDVDASETDGDLDAR